MTLMGCHFFCALVSVEVYFNERMNKFITGTFICFIVIVENLSRRIQVSCWSQFFLCFSCVLLDMLSKVIHVHVCFPLTLLNFTILYCFHVHVHGVSVDFCNLQFGLVVLALSKFLIRKTSLCMVLIFSHLHQVSS